VSKLRVLTSLYGVLVKIAPFKDNSLTRAGAESLLQRPAGMLGYRCSNSAGSVNPHLTRTRSRAF
jgi:hypothetical protein